MIRLRRSRSLALLLAAAASPAGPAGAASLPASSRAAGTPDNVLILIADDLGLEQLAVYGIGAGHPETPVLDSLAAEGVRFRHAWSTPICSPTRSTILTGRYGFRTGVGGLVKPEDDFALPLDEILLPEMLDLCTGGAVAHAAFGKWHLGNATVGGPAAPTLAGWSHFVGTEGSFVDPYHYTFWPKVENGTVTGVTTEYATTDQVDSALDWLPTAPEPWVAYLAFNAPHKPFHEPPAHLHTVDFSKVAPEDLERQQYRAMVQAMDTEIGRLLDELGEIRERTNVVFVGDNGTPPAVVVPPVEPTKAKNTVYQAGINVPLIVNGPAVAVPGGISEALVVTADLFATVADLVGADLERLPPDLVLDSVSLAPYLDDPGLASLRTHAYAASFFPQGTGSPHFFDRAVRDASHKLIATNAGGHELYDLRTDPLELVDLLEGELTPTQEGAYQSLFDELYGLIGLEPAAVLPYGCGVNPAASLTVLKPDAFPGAHVVLGIDNPTGLQAVGSLSLALVSLLPDPGHPCGTPAPGLGMTGFGSTGELLVSFPVAAVELGQAWSAPATPAQVTIPIPNLGSLLGASVFAQGGLWDPAMTFGNELGLSDAAELRIGPSMKQ